MRAVDIIRKKRDGIALEPAEIEAFVAGATKGTWPDYQLSALLMAIVLRGMTDAETAALTRAMVHSGEVLDWSDLPGPKVDKHSTGGVGDKTSLILGPLAAACGVVVPMMSGRGLGHSGGTLDKLESIPGFRVGLSLTELRTALQTVGCALIGQTREIAPADKVLYALRDVTATVESVPLITASILSKKIAEGITGLVMDVKCGRGAFMKNRADARKLAQSLVTNGEANEVHTQALITAMDVPLGRAVGNSLEVIESIETLKGVGPVDLENLSVLLASRMLLLGGLADTPVQAREKVQAALDNGSGLEKLRQIIEHQGGDPRVIDDCTRLPAAPLRHALRAGRAGFVADLHAELIGRAAMALGAGRERADQPVDPTVGILIRAPVGEQVQADDVVLELHYRDGQRLEAALKLLPHASLVTDRPPSPRPVLLEAIAA